jgi:hypothetical protein
MTNEGELLHTRVWRPMDGTQSMVVNLAWSVGSCPDMCYNSQEGDIERGFWAVLNTTVVDLGTDAGTPPIIQVHAAEYSNTVEDPCGVFFDMALQQKP